MAEEEAVVRIVLDDVGKSTPGTAPAPSSAVVPPPAKPAIPAPAASTSMPGGFKWPEPPYMPPPAPAAPAANAAPSPWQPGALSPHLFGRDDQEVNPAVIGGKHGIGLEEFDPKHPTEDYTPKAEVVPPPKEPEFDPVELAKRRVEREEQMAAVDAEYAKLKPPKPDPPFDPKEMAKRRIEAERKAALVDAEYAKLRPKPIFDKLLGVAEDFRGTIGGVFGKVFGVALDLTAKIRSMRAKATTAASVDTSEKAEVPAKTPAPDAKEATKGSALMMPTVPTPQSASVPTSSSAPATPATTGSEQALDGVAAASTDAAKAMSSVVPVAGAVAVALTALAVELGKAAYNEADRQANKYAEYSPKIAEAKALAEMREEMANMRRSQEAEDELSDFIQQQSEVQQKWEDVRVAIMKKVVPVLNAILSVLGWILGAVSQEDYSGAPAGDPTSVLFNDTWTWKEGEKMPINPRTTGVGVPEL